MVALSPAAHPTFSLNSEVEALASVLEAPTQENSARQRLLQPHARWKRQEVKEQPLLKAGHSSERRKHRRSDGDCNWRRGACLGEGTSAWAAKQALRPGNRPCQADAAEVSTLVMRHLDPTLSKPEFLKFLHSHQISPQALDFSVDASGAFRGTCFVHFTSPHQARQALARLGASPELEGRSFRAELLRNRGAGRRFLDAELPPDQLAAVRCELQSFLDDAGRLEHRLPPTFTCLQRKYAHALAEKNGLCHITRQEHGENFVLLTKSTAPTERHALPSSGGPLNCELMTVLAPPPGLELEVSGC